ncbi:probable serine/threonine-protein kinase DDB_G0272254 isoform X2 [Neocloeon triangulifer]|uniref:probable serine/threonine-protein kinase DDB_G0272254 isoform X2 n=1 Tax=Neocloeon triangulifer TaxID=2078957 RepID=UPI00286EC0AD|nr:probable serine/threonine-protein kinase DDB_G0272254 isoform X2 [Neocloeon triangulifer]
MKSYLRIVLVAIIALHWVDSRDNSRITTTNFSNVRGLEECPFSNEIPCPAGLTNWSCFCKTLEPEKGRLIFRNCNGGETKSCPPPINPGSATQPSRESKIQSSGSHNRPPSNFPPQGGANNGDDHFNNNNWNGNSNLNNNWDNGNPETFPGTDNRPFSGGHQGGGHFNPSLPQIGKSTTPPPRVKLPASSCPKPVGLIVGLIFLGVIALALLVALLVVVRKYKQALQQVIQMNELYSVMGLDKSKTLPQADKVISLRKIKSRPL